ncbi:hypothetical protein CCHR01_12842 [Colletotrichum chrysophilum]|uniref:Uncharacterized protein n=1 Tax=Colletotrichum chrysophilum TaxID=1836956 RepID=A0AAD9EEB1_9PEZI|nr:hypothetical protein CCHR01_12842 [Colletotrichum chrysophilum]
MFTFVASALLTLTRWLPSAEHDFICGGGFFFF